MPVDVAGTIAGLDVLLQRCEDATKDIVGDVADELQTLSRANAPIGDPENSTNPPGDLSKSIVVDGPHGGDGFYEALVGPTVSSLDDPAVNYGRQREFGGGIDAKSPGGMSFTRFGVLYSHVRHVDQHGAFYLTRARDEVEPEAEVIIVDRLTAAVEGA